MKRHRMRNILITFLSVLAAALSSSATELHIDKSKNNLVQFSSDAPVEKIIGVTDKIDGYVMWKGDDPVTGSEFYFEVDLASIDTGIGLRNRHMRENYLETDKYPHATYSGKLVKVDKSNSENEYNVAVQGAFKIHGVEKSADFKGQVLVDGNSYRVVCTFDVILSDHKIKIPKLMFLKLSEK